MGRKGVNKMKPHQEKSKPFIHGSTNKNEPKNTQTAETQPAKSKDSSVDNAKSSSK